VVTAPSLEQILAFCAEDPVERVLLEDVARRGLGRFAAVEDEGRLQALCHVGANLVPAGTGLALLADHAAAASPRMIIGAEGAVAELWTAIRPRLPAPRDDRPGQPVFAIREPPPPRDTRLRAATHDELELLGPACAAAHAEEIGVDPLERDPEGFRWRTRNQIEEGRSWLWLEEGAIRFKAEASAWTPSAVQIQQVWVDPGVRGNGYAQRGMRDLLRLLLDVVPNVCLFVRPENAPALHVYGAVGMERVLTYRSLIF
jgi:GNAT superfamily N-acetyltransferase